MASVLRLCQRLLEGPEEQSSESERQSLQLLQVNLERRWDINIKETYKLIDSRKNFGKLWCGIIICE